jgi:Peptidase family M23
MLHYQRRRKCGSVMRELPLRWDEPVEVSPPVRGTFIWGNSHDHTGFDAHAWPGPRAAFDIGEENGPADGGQDVYAMAGGFVVEVSDPQPTMNDPNPNQSVTVWHPDLELWTGYYHLKPDTITVQPGQEVTIDEPIAKLGKSGTKDPHLHTGGHRLDVTGFGRPVPLRFTGLTDDQGATATQTPANGKYTS